MREAIWVKKIEPFKYVPLLHKVNAGRDNQSHPLYARWNNMLARCYNPSDKDYKLYGANACSVCLPWHDFLKYVKDVQALEGYSLAKDLDKDYEGSNQYNPEVCRWLSHSDNSAYSGRPVYIGNKLFVRSLDAAETLRISLPTLSMYLNKDVRLNLSYLERMSLDLQKVRYALKEGYVARYKDLI